VPVDLVGLPFGTDGTIADREFAAPDDSDHTSGRLSLEALYAFSGRPQRDFAPEGM
jgi:hypothetical protein